MSRRNEMSRNFLIHRNSRHMRHMTGAGVDKSYKNVLPISVSNRQELAEQLGIKGAGTSALLLSDARPYDTQFKGTGFGVRAPNPNLLGKIDGLSVGKKRKNVNINF